MIEQEQLLAYVEDEICDSFGVLRPPSSRSCHAANCPHWEATEWTEVSIELFLLISMFSVQHLGA
jgi:hypothetical protein